MQPDEPFVADIDDPPCLVTTTEGAALLQRAERAEGENAKLRADAARWNYMRLECSQIGSAIMSGQHYWRFRQPYGLRGQTIDSAMDNAMRERPLLLAAALAGKGGA